MLLHSLNESYFILSAVIADSNADIWINVGVICTLMVFFVLSYAKMPIFCIDSDKRADLLAKKDP